MATFKAIVIEKGESGQTATLKEFDDANLMGAPEGTEVVGSIFERDCGACQPIGKTDSFRHDGSPGTSVRAATDAGVAVSNTSIATSSSR